MPLFIGDKTVSSARKGGVDVSDILLKALSAGVGTPAAPWFPTVASLTGFGSSSIEGVGADTTAQRMLNLLQTVSGAATLRNKGVGGTVLQGSNDAGGSPRANNGLSRYQADLLGSNLSEAYVMTWPNDLRYIGAPSTFNVEGYTRDFKRILNGMLYAGVDPTMIFLGTPTWYDASHYAIGSSGFSGSTDAINQEYGEATRQLAIEFGTRFVDLYTAIKDGGGLSLFVSGDVHWNNTGHATAAAAFQQSKLLNKKAKPTNLAASSSGPGLLSLSADGVTGAQFYQTVLMSGDQDGNSFSSANAPSYTDIEVTPGTYRIKVRACFAPSPFEASASDYSPWAYYDSSVVVADPDAGTDTVIGSDDFRSGKTANAELSTVTADDGAWTKESYSTGVANIVASADSLMGPQSNSQFAVYTLGDSDLGNGVYAEATLLNRSNVVSNLVAYLALRASDAQASYYAAGYNGSALRILRYVNGSATVLGTYNVTLGTGSESLIRFEVEDGEQRLYLDGNLIVTTNDAEANAATMGTGMGIRMGSASASWSSTTGPHFLDIEVGQLAA